MYLSKEQMEISEELDWKVTEDNEEIIFQKQSNAGEDVCFSIAATDDIPHEVFCVAEEFEPEEHVKMWISNYTEHHDAIPDIFTLVEDAKNIKYEFDMLATSLLRGKVQPEMKPKSTFVDLLLPHKGHDVEIVSYGDNIDVSLECNTCGCVICDSDLYDLAGLT